MSLHKLAIRAAVLLMGAFATTGVLVLAADRPATNPEPMANTVPVAAAAPVPPAKPIPKELQPFQGFWKVELCDSAAEGFGAPQREVEKWRWTVRGDEITWNRRGEEWKLSLRVDPDKKPMEIDLTYLSGPFKGEKALGMYEWGGIDGKSLLISIQDPGADVPRPNRIEMRGDGRTSLIFLRRIEPLDPVKELVAFQGTWTVDNIQTDAWPKPIGKLPDANGRGSERKWVIKGNELTWTGLDGKEVKASFTIDPNKVPGHIDLTFLSGPHKGETCPGVYERLGPDGTGLWLCLTDPGSKTARPKDISFASNEGRSWIALSAFKTPAEQERRLLQGVWKFEVCESEWWPVNHPTTKDEFPKWRWVVKGNEMNWTGVSTGDVKVSFTVDPTTSPKQIDFTFLDGPNKGQKCLGIYKLKGESLWVFVQDPGTKGERPAEFAAGRGKGQSFLVLDPVERKK